MKHCLVILMLVLTAFNSGNAQSKQTGIPQLIKNGKANKQAFNLKPEMHNDMQMQCATQP